MDSYGGESTGEKCYFPFYYRGVKTGGCINDDWQRRDGKYLCAVLMADEISTLSGDRVTWGFCNVIGEHVTVLFFKIKLHKYVLVKDY